MSEYINLTPENIEDEHLCCIIRSKTKHPGVEAKRQWLKERITEGHVFRKLNVKGKVFVEYAPLESAWTPISGNNFLYIYCLWVSGSYSGKGYAKELLEYVIEEAKKKGKNGICTISSKKKKPFLSEKKFLYIMDFKWWIPLAIMNYCLYHGIISYQSFMTVLEKWKLRTKNSRSFTVRHVLM